MDAAVAYDARAAWEGVLPEHPDLPIRIEAAGYHNLPVYFRSFIPGVIRSARKVLPKAGRVGLG